MSAAHRFAVVVLLAQLGLAQANDCAREDIDHYLDRGFTPQQVLELCRPASAGADAASRTPTEDRDLQADLRELIDGFDIGLDATHLLFSRELCVAYDRPNYAEQRKKACGTAHYRIARAGLSVVDSRSRLLFWGRDAVMVQSSDVTQRYELGQDRLGSRDQARLAEELDDGVRVEIPVRKGSSPEQLRRSLEQLSVRAE